MITQTRATIDDLYKVEGKAELVNGEIIVWEPKGWREGFAEDEIFVALRMHIGRIGIGRAIGCCVGFQVNLPHRESFCPDAAYHLGANTGMRFLEGAPIFAVEVRSENDYGAKAEHDIAAKIADYFAAGTQVVWDVDLLSLNVIKKYSAQNPDKPQIFRRGEIADAEPAVPGWTMTVDALFPS